MITVKMPDVAVPGPPAPDRSDEVSPVVLGHCPPAWLVGMSVLPFGLVVGFSITALPYLLAHAGISVDRIASISAIVMSPTFWGFLVNPIMDSGLSRQSYCWITLIVGAVCVALGLAAVSPSHIPLMTGLLLVGELAAVLYANAQGGWMTEFVPESSRGAVGGWTNVANLGGGAIGSMAVMAMSGRIGVRWLGFDLALLVLLGGIPLLFFPPARKSSFSLYQAFSSALAATWQVSTRRDSLIGFILFLSPAAAVAAINLFSGLGNDFHTSERMVIAVTGAGCAITASIGSLLGGFASGRLPRGYVYLSGGIAAGICSLTMAFTLHTQHAFVVGVLVYNACAGIIYAAFTALCLELVGHGSPVAATQLGLFAAATNGAIDFMTWADGRGYKHFGVRGLLTTDGAATFLAAIPLLYLFYRELQRKKRITVAA
jgi:PAT family beta-lactamase induction signal transducer AmpG